MDDSPQFLQKVRASHFAKSVKRSERRSPEKHPTWFDNRRKVVRYENPQPNDIYTVVGTVNLKEGWSDYIGQEEGYAFDQTGSIQVYTIAKSIGRRVYALASDLTDATA